MSKILVTRKNLSSCLKKLHSYKVHAFDTETTGLFPYKKSGDRMFSMVISTVDDDFYFNFNSSADHLGNKIPSEYILSRSMVPEIVKTMTDSLVFIHNAKFDMAITALELFGINLHKIAKIIHCTQAIARVCQNTLMNLQLDRLVKSIGVKKSDEAKEYCVKHKLVKNKKVLGKKTPEKVYFFEKIPFKIIANYACIDGNITLKLGLKQLESIKRIDSKIENPHQKPLSGVMDMERKLTTVLFKMELTGIKVNMQFVQDAMKFELERIPKLEARFVGLGGEGVTSISEKKSLINAFTNNKLYFPKTDKGNPSFKKDLLEGMNHEIAKIILDYRDAEKKVGTYYGKIIELADEENVIHCNFKQGGAQTGRMSCSNPNLQNQTKIEEDDPRYFDKYLVRRCYVPRENSMLVMIDFDQMEYRMMLDYAGEMGLIEQVLQGVDVHQATANFVEVTRKEAKTINFMLLYGGGVAKLAMALYKPKLPESLLKDVEKLHRWEEHSAEYISKKLDIDLETIEHDISELDKAFNIREKYFSKLPKVKQFVSKVKNVAKKRGYIFNWFGRKYLFSKNSHYKAPNYLIQGGAADVVKLAMIELDKFLENYKSKMLIQVHDEVVFEIVKGEEHIVPKLKEIMESIYPYSKLPLTCGVDYSTESWQDKKVFEFA